MSETSTNIDADTGTVPEPTIVDDTVRARKVTTSDVNDDSTSDTDDSVSSNGCALDVCDHVVHCLHPEEDLLEKAEANRIDAKTYSKSISNKTKRLNYRMNFQRQHMRLDRQKWKHAAKILQYKRDQEQTKKENVLLDQYQGHYFEDWLKNAENGRNCKMDRLNADYEQDYRENVEQAQLEIDQEKNNMEKEKAESDNRMMTYRQQYDHRVAVEKLAMEDRRIAHETKMASLRTQYNKYVSDAELLKHYGAFVPDSVIYGDSVDNGDEEE